MENSSKVDEFMMRTGLSVSQLRDNLSQTPGDMGETVSMMNVIDRVFSQVKLDGEAPEELIAAKKQELEGNSLAYWTDEGGALDTNGEERLQATKDQFQETLEELDSPGHCLRECLEFCDTFVRRLEGEIGEVQAGIEDMESARVGIAEDIISREADIADFRSGGWVQQHRRRRQLSQFLREYRDLCRNALLIEVFYRVRLRCMDILNKVKSLVESERMRIAGLMAEVSDLVAQLTAKEQELETFDYDSLVPNGHVLLESDDLDSYFTNYRPRTGGEPINDEELAEGLLIELYKVKGSIRGYMDRMKSHIGPVLLEMSHERFKPLKSMSVQEVLETKYVDTKSGRDASRLLAHLSSRIDESGCFLKISSLEKTGSDRKIAVRCVSVKGGENSRLAREWLPSIANRDDWNVVEGFSNTEIVFYQTEYAYPIYSVTAVKEFLKAYKASSRRKSENIFHLYPEYAALPELIPFNRKQALEAFHKAAAIGILSKDNGSGWIYSQNGDKVSLGRDMEGILDFLRTNQKVVSQLDRDFRRQLLQEGGGNILQRMLKFAQEHDDSDGVMDRELLKDILLRLEGDLANGGVG